MHYHERRFRAVRDFHLDGSTLHVTGDSPRARFESHIDLKTVDKVTGKIWVRPIAFNKSVWFVVIGIVASSVLYWTVDNPLPFLIVLVFSLPFVITAIMTCRRVEFARFKNKAGVIAFDVARSGPDKHKFDDFVAAVVTAIPAVDV